MTPTGGAVILIVMTKIDDGAGQATERTNDADD